MTTDGAADRGRSSGYRATIRRDDGCWGVQVEEVGLELKVDRLGCDCRTANAVTSAALSDRLGRTIRTVSIVLVAPRLPPHSAIRQRPRRVGKNMDWFVVYDGAIDRVSFGDFSVGELVEAYETIPDDVLVVVAYQPNVHSVGDGPEPAEVVSTAYFAIDPDEIYLVRDEKPESGEMATGAGIPRLLLPVMTRADLAERIATMIAR